MFPHHTRANECCQLAGHAASRVVPGTLLGLCERHSHRWYNFLPGSPLKLVMSLSGEKLRSKNTEETWRESSSSLMSRDAKYTR
jgi:hypothetical protein